MFLLLAMLISRLGRPTVGQYLHAYPDGYRHPSFCHSSGIFESAHGEAASRRDRCSSLPMYRANELRPLRITQRAVVQDGCGSAHETLLSKKCLSPTVWDGGLKMFCQVFTTLRQPTSGQDLEHDHGVPNQRKFLV